MENPTHKPLVQYFENLNAQLIDFKPNSFFRQDLEDIFGAFRTGITFPAMALESPEGDGESSTEQNSVIGRIFAFVIYMNPQQDNSEEQDTMLNDCEIIGKKLLSRMRWDANNPNSILYRKFKVNTCKWIKVGPVYSERLYGYRFSGLIEGNESLKVDPADWKDIIEVCK